MATEVTLWKANDGSTHPSKFVAEQHELKCMIVKHIVNIYPSKSVIDISDIIGAVMSCPTIFVVQAETLPPTKRP